MDCAVFFSIVEWGFVLTVFLRQRIIANWWQPYL
jgi:hypothetical protein